jgi:hypothetical protein
MLLAQSQRLVGAGRKVVERLAHRRGRNRERDALEGEPVE